MQLNDERDGRRRLARVLAEGPDTEVTKVLAYQVSDKSWLSGQQVWKRSREATLLPSTPSNSKWKWHIAQHRVLVSTAPGEWR